MGSSSGYFKEIGDAFPKLPGKDALELIYSSPAGPYLLYKGLFGERIAVFKCLKEEFRGDEVYEAIIRHEYEIAQPLKHPGVCDYLSMIRIEGLGNTIVMEWIDGCTLGDFIGNGPVSPETAKSIVLQLCDAVSYIHRKQVLHNDLKPENVMVTREGNVVKVIDFSLADSPSMARGHIPAGTQGYAAPEVVAGGEASVRSDIFSLGKIISIMMPSRQDVYERCLLEDPSGRFTSVEEVRKAIETGRPQKRRLWIILPVLAAALIALAIWPKAKPSSMEPSYDEVFRNAAALAREYDSAVPSLDASGYSFTDTLDCLNGMFIVATEDGNGLMDSSGSLILEPSFDEIEFILPDVALLGKNGLYRLCARDGRIFAEAAEREDLVSSAQELYEKRMFEDMRRWDNALDELELLRDECLNPGSEETVTARLEAFKSALGNVSGRMTDSQRARLEKIL